MRYELTDYEWAAVRPFLPNKPRGVPRVNDRRVLNGIFWILRSGAPWRDLPESFGPYTTCYNRFVRWGRAGVWDRIMDALAAAHDAAVKMIDTSVLNRLRAASDDEVRLIVCDLSASPYLDLAGSRMLNELHSELTTRGIKLRVVGAHGSVRDLLRADGMDEKLGRLDRVVSLDSLLRGGVK